MPTKNRLPEYWIIEEDISHPNWQDVLGYIKESTDNHNWGAPAYSNKGYFLGYCKQGWIIPPNFKGKPDECQLLTINEFMQLANELAPIPEPNAVAFQKITDSIAKVLTEKNKRYGNSALSPLLVFGGKSKVGSRADDKISRIRNSITLQKNDCCDLIGYLILICQENGWEDFSDQID